MFSHAVVFFLPPSFGRREREILMKGSLVVTVWHRCPTLLFFISTIYLQKSWYTYTSPHPDTIQSHPSIPLIAYSAISVPDVLFNCMLMWEISDGTQIVHFCEEKNVFFWWKKVHILCGEKLSGKFCLWRKMTNIMHGDEIKWRVSILVNSGLKEAGWIIMHCWSMRYS